MVEFKTFSSSRSPDKVIAELTNKRSDGLNQIAKHKRGTKTVTFTWCVPNENSTVIKNIDILIKIEDQKRT